ncbi:MAG: PAS domain-containing protein [Clostridia bacterium]|nr:PAS domain-containing protein [Clostridia bacterium]
MTGRIFKYAFLLGATVLVLCAVLFFGVQYAQTKEETYAALRQEARYASRGVVISGAEYLSTLDDDINRVTWIAADGSVLYDSEFGTDISNQKQYEEVSAALADGEGHGIRKSVSGGTQTMYYAVRCSDGTVLRLSRPMAAVRKALVAVAPVLWIFILVLLISGILAFRTAKSLIKPINEIDLDEPDAQKIYPELAPLVDRIRDQKLTIREQMDELAGKQREFSALTDNMSEGFVLTDADGIVLSVNTEASRMLGIREAGTDLTAPEAADNGSEKPAGHDIAPVRDALAGALKGNATDTVISIGERSVQLIVNPVISRGKVTGAVVLLVDVTEREQRESLRREFSANVSHELKTPLTSISGFAELMMQGLVSGDKVREFSADIYRESGRLIALVEDIIKLSRLDAFDEQEADRQMMERVDLYSLCEDALDTLRPAADKRCVRMTLTGEPAFVCGVTQFVDEIVYNLCDNAVKYNKDGGSVDISVEKTPEGVLLTVADTGIGIPFEQQERVFERFYRVNKSHSRSVAGTGLGLSIVKHAVQACGAKVSLESQPGEGTTMRVLFREN